MDTPALIDVLGYSGSPSYVTADRVGEVHGHAHLLRRAVRGCNVRGVYLLRRHESPAGASWPVIYVAEAQDDAEAERIHRRVWNQSLVPFLIVRLPQCVRLCSGFSYQRHPAAGAEPGVLEAAIGFDEVASRLAPLSAAGVDSGQIWLERAWHVPPEARVDRCLQGSLETLGEQLRAGGLPAPVAAALIGRLIYLRYLRDRGLLSRRTLEPGGGDPTVARGEPALHRSWQALCEGADSWLQGAVPPLSLTGPEAPPARDLQLVAGALLGAEPASSQLEPDFQSFDFSYLPVELLAGIYYEQLPAITGAAKRNGAASTPPAVVSFMLAELAAARPLRPGMRVLDPACGTGAFLVSCYRRLVEHQLALQGTLRPAELSELLTHHVFGIERDAAACRAAALALQLTLLDYLEPADLQAAPSFELPALQGTNIIEGDFFDPSLSLGSDASAFEFDWVVGSPPWVKLTGDSAASDWIQHHGRDLPVASLQLAEAVAWKAARHLRRQGAAGLLLPASTLFAKQKSFRTRLFSTLRVWAVANFANLHDALFRKRPRPGAAAVFFGRADEAPAAGGDLIVVFSPLVANQAASQASGQGERPASWAITLNAGEVTAVPRSAVRTGDPLPWKLAMWGSSRDERLLRSLSAELPPLADFASRRGLSIREVLQLRDPERQAPDSQGRPRALPDDLIIPRLARHGRIFSLPAWARLEPPPDRAFVRQGRGDKPLEICKPPYIIIQGDRSFAVYCDDSLVFPARQIGISGPRDEALMLRALSLFLSSHFVTYFEFFHSPQAGVRGLRRTLADLKRVPTPLDRLDAATLGSWLELHADLVAATDARWQAGSNGEPTLTPPASPAAEAQARQQQLEAQLNAAVADLLGLRAEEQWLIEDLVHIRRHLVDGQLPEVAVRPPDSAELEEYARVLEQALDEFLCAELQLAHRAVVIADGHVGAVEIRQQSLAGGRGAERSVARGPQAQRPRVQPADGPAALELRRVRDRVEEQHPQWLYFQRNLLYSTASCSYIFKPLQRFLWTRSQALADADEIISSAIVSRA